MNRAHPRWTPAGPVLFGEFGRFGGDLLEVTCPDCPDGRWVVPAAALRTLVPQLLAEGASCMEWSDFAARMLKQ